MDAVVEKKKPVAVLRWLPYWAVFQYDVGQTLRSWVYRVWVLAVLLGVGGFLLRGFFLTQEAGYFQQASTLFSNVLQGAVLGSLAFVVVLSGGCISSERGTLADSVLSRGISRYQYFLGKWHARLATVLGTYLVLSLLALAGSLALVHEDVTLDGGLVALAVVGVLLAAVTTIGVAVSAVSNNTLLGVAGLWVALYGSGFALSLNWVRKVLPNSPAVVFNRLPNILCGYYNFDDLGPLLAWSGAVSLAAALAGMICFSRRDV
ncbi:MAG TPA: ABC transporter permease subunit [Gemmataceae bacterium]|nr:ABC transporter permease subunit [Gemmataceae bacterium]